MAKHTILDDVVFDIGDGPEGITLYFSEEEAIVDWAATVPALYLTASTNDSYVKLGPFILPKLHEFFREVQSKINAVPPKET